MAASPYGVGFLFVSDLTVGPKNEPVNAIVCRRLYRHATSTTHGANRQAPALWMRLVKMRTGVTHAYQYWADGKPVGNRTDVSGYNPDSYPHPGVPKGKLSDKQTIVSKIYDGMKADYWYYASPGVDPNVPAPLMVWQDGQGLIAGDLSKLRLFTVTENLIAQKLIPPMVHVLIAPGFAPDGKAMRSIEYDTVNDRYNRFLMEEVLPQVEKVYKLRQDGYSRGIAGESSGGICSLNSAWFNPEKFARVHSTIGSYTSIQWHPEEKLDGGNLYPFMVRKMPKRNIRIWMSDGADDLGKHPRLLAATKYPTCEFTQNARIRFPFPLRPSHARFRTSRH